MIEGRAGRHQRGGSEDALTMRVDNALVDVAREAEVVGVRNQEFQSCNGSRFLTVAVL